MAVSILQRKRDCVYLVFFLTHLPVMLGEFSVDRIWGVEGREKKRGMVEGG
jgi:hypothetical protein